MQALNNFNGSVPATDHTAEEETVAWGWGWGLTGPGSEPGSLQPGLQVQNGRQEGRLSHPQPDSGLPCL